MKKTLFIITLLASAGFIKAQSLSDAVNEIRNENLLKAKKILIHILPSDNNGNAAFYLGNVYLKLEEKDSARYYYEKSASYDDVYAYIAKARVIQLNNGDTASMQSNLEKAISSSKRRNAEVYFQVGMMAFKPEAFNVNRYLAYMQQAIDLEPSNKYYPLIMGDMYLALKQGGKALSMYEQVYDSDPNNVLANIRIGRIYYSAQNYDLAISHLEKANSINASYGIAHKELGELYYLTKQYDKASNEFKTYISLNDNDDRIKVAYSGFLYQLKEYDRAISEVSNFLSTDTNNYSYIKILAYCYLEKNEPLKAQAYMNQYWKKVPENKILGLDYIYAGKISNANGDTAKAVSYMRKAVQTDTANAEILSDFAVILYNTNRYQEAISVLNRRLTMKEPASALDFYWLGRAYYNTDQYVLADSAFAGFVKLQPTLPDGYLWRAKCNQELEKTSLQGLSAEHYKKYIEIASANPDKNKTNLIKAYFYLAFVAIIKKDNESAKLYLNKVLELDPEDKNAKSELARLK